jgi:putative salt-induced outer membrane protein
MKLKTLAIAACAALMAAPALAQTPAAPAWTGEGTFGAGLTTGNTETTDVSAGLKLKHTGAVWTQSGELSAEYGETDSTETRNRIAAAFQLDRSFNDRLRGYGRLAYERDEFSGFENRTFAGVGVAYDVIKSEPTTWTLQGGPGYRIDEIRARTIAPVAPSRSEESFAVMAGSRFKHQINERVALTNDTDVIYTDVTTQVVNGLALTFDLSGNLQGRISYDVRHDTDPPLGFEKTDTATRFSLVYKLK